LQEVKEAFQQPAKYEKKNEILPIVERYKFEVSTWRKWEENNEGNNNSNWSGNDYFEPTPVMIPVRNEPKIGRNEPCPCGSGKKHKKCCLNK